MLDKNYDPGISQGAQFLPSSVVGAYGFTGNYYYVKPGTGSDSENGLTPDTAMKTLGAALTAATANHGDCIFLIAQSNTSASTTDYQSLTSGTQGLIWNKDGVHLIGISDGAMIGSRARIAQKSGTITMTDLMTVTANNCLFMNLEIYQGIASSAGQATRALVIGTAGATGAVGQRNKFVNCQISGIGDSSMDIAGSRSLIIYGNATENSFVNCYIGLDTVVRATATSEVEFVGVAGTNAKPARTTFEDCIINSYTSSSTFKAITTTSIDRFVLLKNCMISAVQNPTGAVAPTGAIINTTPNGTVNLLGSGVFGYANISTITDANIYVLSYAGLATHATLPGIAAGQQTT